MGLEVAVTEALFKVAEEVLEVVVDVIGGGGGGGAPERRRTG